MTVAIFSNTGSEKTPYSQWIEESEKDVVLFVPSSQKSSFTKEDGYRLIVDFESYIDNSEIERKFLDLHKEYKFKNLITLSEFDIIRGGKLRSLLDLDGQKFFSAEAFRNKVLMKQIVENSGIKVPNYQSINTRGDINSFIKKNPFPVVIKPIYGSGSEETYIIKTEVELNKFIQSNNNKLSSFLIEEFVEGDMYHVDGIIINGNLQFNIVSKYQLGCMSFTEGKPVASYILSNANPLYKIFTNEVVKVIESLPTPKNTSFHAEFFLNGDNQLVFCEIASRSGGGEIVSTIECATKININKSSVLAQLGKEKQLQIQDYNLAGFILIPPRQGIFKGYKESIPFSWVEKFDVKALINEQYEDPQFSADTITSVIVVGETEELIKERISIVIDWVNSNIMWEDLQ